MSNGTVDKKELILRSFIKLVEEYGINRVTLSDVAQRSGLTKSGLYYYFDSKEALFLETLNMVYEKIRELMVREVEPIADPVEKFKRFIALQIDVFTDDSLELSFLSKCSIEMMDEIERFVFSSPALVERMNEIHRHERENGDRILKEILVARGVAAATADRMTAKIYFLVEGFLFMLRKTKTLANRMPHDMQEASKETGRDIAELLMHGILGVK